MKTLQFSTLILFALIGLNLASADTLLRGTEQITSPEKTKLQTVQTQVLASNTALKAEIDRFESERLALKKAANPPSAQVHQAMIAKRNVLEQKLRAALLKADPTLQPVLAKMTPPTSTISGTQSRQ